VLGPIASVGSTVAIGGVTCDGSPCSGSDGELAVVMLNDDRDEWVELAVPDVWLSSETEMSTVAGPLTHAVFSIGDTVGPVPAGVPTTNSDECAGGRFAFHWADTQHVLSTATWEWFTERSTWSEISSSPMFDDGPGQIAVAPGGAVAFAVRSGGLYRRDGDGPWMSTWLTSGGVYATDDAVLTLDPSSGTFEAVWEVGD